MKASSASALIIIVLSGMLLAACGSVPQKEPSLGPTPAGLSAQTPAATAAPVVKTPGAPFWQPAPPPGGRQVVIDSDMASDDWMAILYLLNRRDVQVKAITVSGTGEAHCEPGVRHVLGLLALAGYSSIPVACGRTTPLQGNHAFPDAWRQGVDSLFGLSLPSMDVPAGSSNAVEVLTAAIQSSPQRVDVLILGPLTTLAEVVQKTPALLNNLGTVYVMGGAVDVPGNVKSSGSGIDNDAAEWNIYIDPHAANVVLKSGAPVTLVPLDATNDVPVTEEFYNKVKGDHAAPEANFVYDLYTANNWFYQSGTLYFWDQSTAAVLTDESLATYDYRTLCVVEDEGPTSGQTKTSAGCPQVRVASALDRGRFEQMFLDGLNGR